MYLEAYLRYTGVISFVLNPLEVGVVFQGVVIRHVEHLVRFVSPLAPAEPLTHQADKVRPTTVYLENTYRMGALSIKVHVFHGGLFVASP